MSIASSPMGKSAVEALAGRAAAAMAAGLGAPVAAVRHVALPKAARRRPAATIHGTVTRQMSTAAA